MRSRTMVRTVGAATAAVLLLAGCGSASDDVAAPEPAPTSESPSPEETAQPEETSSADEAGARWGDGVWPEGYSFELPNGLSLQEEVIDPVESGDMFESSPPYRRIAFDGHGPLMVAPEGLHGIPMDQAVLQQALAFGARIYIEEFIDSELLTKNYTREAEKEWFDGFRDQAWTEVHEHFDESFNQPLKESGPALSLGWPMFRPSEDSDSDADGDSDSDSDGDRFVWWVHGPRYDEGGPRLANVEASLVDGEHIFHEGGDVLRLNYEGSQSVLLSVSDDEDDPERRLAGLTFDSEVELLLWNEGSGWYVRGFSHDYTWNVDDHAG